MKRPAYFTLGLAMLTTVVLRLSAAEQQTEQEKVVAEIKRTAGTVEFDESSPDKPAISVDITGYRATDTVLEHLKVLTGLQDLAVTNCHVTDAGLRHLSGLTRLRTLDLWNAQITDAGLEQLQGLTELQALNLMLTKITDAGLKHIAGLTTLQELDLSNTSITDAALEQLKGLTQLRILNLYNTKVSDAGLPHLKGLTELRELRLDSTNVTDAGFEHLKGLTKLEKLSLPGTIPAKAVRSFRKAMPKTFIRHTPETPSNVPAEPELGAAAERTLASLAYETVEAINSGEKEKALAIIDEAASQKEIDIRTGFAAAEAAFLLEAHGKAIKVMERVVRELPKETAPGMDMPVDLMGTLLIGTYARFGNDPARAKAAYNSLLAMANEDAPWAVLCYVYLAEIESHVDGRPEKAIELLNRIGSMPRPRHRAERTALNFWKSYARYEAALLRQGHEANIAAGKEWRLDDDYVSEALVLGSLAVGFGDQAELGSAYEPKPFRMEAKMAAEQAFTERGLRYAVQSRVSRIDRAMALGTLGWLLEKRRAFAEAEQCYTDLFESDSFFAPQAGFFLAHCQKAEGKDTDAKAMLQKVVARFPSQKPRVEAISREWWPTSPGKN